MALFSEAGWLFLLRWIHFLSGITWIGLLYYFNLVQVPFFAEMLHYWLGRRGLTDPGTWVILLGGIIGSVMWANVWFVIWPNNKIVIQNAIDTAAGKPANPAAAPAGARGGLASRTNVVLSIPMLWFMGSASHMPPPMPGSGALFWIVALIIVALVEANALWGTPGQGAAKPLATIKGTLWAGFILTAVFYVWFGVVRG